MLAKRNRANPAEIVLAREEGRLVPGRFFSLLIFDLNDQRAPRFAFVVSTKIDKRAVRRNRVKRLLRTSIRELLPEIKKGKIVLFLARKSLLDKNSQTVKEEMERMLRI